MNSIVCCYWFNVHRTSPPPPHPAPLRTSPLTSPPTKGECIFDTGGGHSYQFVIYAACSSVMFPINLHQTKKELTIIITTRSIPFITYRCTGWWWKQDRLSVPAKWSSHVSQDLYRGLQSDVYATDLPVSKEKHYNMKHFSSVSKNTSVPVAHNIITFKNSKIKKAKGDVHALTGKPQVVSVKKLNFLVCLLTQVQQ